MMDEAIKGIDCTVPGDIPQRIQFSIRRGQVERLTREHDPLFLKLLLELLG